MDAKEFLKQIERLEAAIEIKREQLAELQAAAYSLPGMSYDQPQVLHSPVPDQIPSTVANLMSLEESLLEDMNRLQKIKDKVIRTILQLPEKKHVDVLYRRYVLHMTYEAIGAELHYSEDHVKRLHREALAEIDKSCH